MRRARLYMVAISSRAVCRGSRFLGPTPATATPGKGQLSQLDKIKAISPRIQRAARHWSFVKIQRDVGGRLEPFNPRDDLRTHI